MASLAYYTSSRMDFIDGIQLRRLECQRHQRPIPQVLNVSAEPDRVYQGYRLWFVSRENVLYAVMATNADEAWMQVDDIWNPATAADDA